MIISQNSTNSYQPKCITKNNTPSFGAVNPKMKELGDISRRVRLEFPALSNTKLMGFKNINSNIRNYNYLVYVRKLMSKYREYYNCSTNARKVLLRELSGMKKMNIGNCGEMADATYIALKLNGVEDVKLVQLYAYDKSTGSMRNLDHTVVGINFRLPKGYKYHKWDSSEHRIDNSCRIYPQNDSIIVDTWAGFADYGKNAAEYYKSNRALIECNKLEYSPRNRLLYDSEELCYIPIKEYKLKDMDFKYFEKTYPNLILDKNKSSSEVKTNLFRRILNSAFGIKQKDVTQRKKYKFDEMSDHIRAELRYNCGLKSAPTAEEMAHARAEYQKIINEKYNLKVEIKE